MVWRGGYHGEGMGDEMVIIIIELATSVRIAVIARLVLTVTPAGGWQNHFSSPLIHLHAGGDGTCIVRHGDSLVSDEGGGG